MRVEPRYHYNYLKRVARGKKLLIIQPITFRIGRLSIWGKHFGDNAHALQALSIIPRWGLKRTVGNHFVFEFAAGIGAYTSEIETWKPTLGLDLKFGYSF